MHIEYLQAQLHLQLWVNVLQDTIWNLYTVFPNKRIILSLQYCSNITYIHHIYIYTYIVKFHSHNSF